MTGVAAPFCVCGEGLHQAVAPALCGVFTG